MLTVKDIQLQEADNQFTNFSNDVAIELGELLVKYALEQKAAVAVDITRSRQQLFHAVLPGAQLDNNKWLQRKINTVYEFGISSLQLQLEFGNDLAKIENNFLLNKNDFAAAGGAFPINIKGTGFIGTIACSGLASEEDHNLCVKTISAYLKGTRA